MMTANNVKKEIINEWSQEFSDLSIYSQNKLYKILGSFVIGIETLNLPRSEDYRPIFVCYPLWKSNIKECLNEPIFLQEIYNKKGFQFNIPYTNHNVFFLEAVECVKKQVAILSYRNISLNQLFATIDEQFFQILIKASPVAQAKLLEAKLFASLYVEDVLMVEKVLEEIKKSSKTWSPNLFEWKYGKVDVWLQGLQDCIYHQNSFLRQVEVNKQEKKIKKLQSFELLK